MQMNNMRWLRAAAIGIVVMLGCQPRSMASEAAGGASYALAPGDDIAVTVFGQPQFSGDVPVDEAGNVVLPFIGPVHAAGLTASECANLIRKRLADGFLNHPLVNVAIKQLRPVYILGGVRSPGAYPFRYGSTVESLVALAGGFGVPGLGAATALANYLSAQERVRRLVSEQTALRLRAARLEAERDGRPSFTVPASLALGSNPALRKAVAEEQATLASETAVHGAQLALLRGQKPRLKRQIDAIKAQIATGRARVEFVKREAQRSSKLLRQGLGLRGADVQLKLDEANAEMGLWNLEAQLWRGQIDLGNLDVQIERSEAQFGSRISADLQKVRERLDAVDISLPAAQAIRDVKLQQAESAASAGQDRAIDITRMRDGRAVVTKAAETTPLQPGDVVEVKVKLPAGLGVLEARAD